MKTLVTYRFRPCPNGKRERLMEDTFETCGRPCNSLLATANSNIVFEALKISNTKALHLASPIMNSAWGKLRQLTAHEAE